jgi:hypothetical protein
MNSWMIEKSQIPVFVLALLPGEFVSKSMQNMSPEKME